MQHFTKHLFATPFADDSLSINVKIPLSEASIIA